MRGMLSSLKPPVPDGATLMIAAKGLYPLLPPILRDAEAAVDADARPARTQAPRRAVRHGFVEVHVLTVDPERSYCCQLLLQQA